MPGGTRRTRTVLLGILVAMGTGSCGDRHAARLPVDADEYIAAVQYHDATGLIKRMATFRAELLAVPREGWPDVRARHLALAEARIDSYEQAKSTGRLPMVDDGIDLIQGLAIGKGIYYRFDEVRLEEGGVHAVGILEVIPDYDPRRLRGLPRGTRIYLMGDPLGTLETLKLGTDPEEQTVRVVETIRLEWRFAWFEATDVYPDGWAVESIRPVPDGVQMTELRRVF